MVMKPKFQPSHVICRRTIPIPDVSQSIFMFFCCFFETSFEFSPLFGSWSRGVRGRSDAAAMWWGNMTEGSPGIGPEYRSVFPFRDPESKLTPLLQKAHHSPAARFSRVSRFPPCQVPTRLLIGCRTLRPGALHAIIPCQHRPIDSSIFLSRIL